MISISMIFKLLNFIGETTKGKSCFEDFIDVDIFEIL
jgi:hypothetical protein